MEHVRNEGGWTDKLKIRFADNDFALGLFERDLICALLHEIFCVIFFCLGVWEMGVYNILSSIYFYVLAYLLWSQKITNNEKMDNLISLEFVLHSILATYFTGFALGYQYILFVMAVPVTVLTDDKEYLRFNSLRTFFSIGLYVVLSVLLQYGILLPKYYFTDTIALINNSFLIMVVFLALNSQMIANFRIYKNHMKEYRQKELLNIQKMNDIQKKVIRNVAGVIEERDSATGEHTERTTTYAEEICNELIRTGKYTDVLDEDMVYRITQSAALHDIGKIKTPDAVLNKPGKLTPEEFEIIKKHTIDGGKIIRQIFQDIDDKEYEEIAYDIVMYHHEKWDGSGYPEGLKGEEIPLCARIMAVADVFDALVSERVYKSAMSIEKSLEIIAEDSGKHFDPDVTEAFLRVCKTRQKEL